MPPFFLIEPAAFTRLFISRHIGCRASIPLSPALVYRAREQLSRLMTLPLPRHNTASVSRAPALRQHEPKPAACRKCAAQGNQTAQDTVE